MKDIKPADKFLYYEDHVSRGKNAQEYNYIAIVTPRIKVL